MKKTMLGVIMGIIVLSAAIIGARAVHHSGRGRALAPQLQFPAHARVGMWDWRAPDGTSRTTKEHDAQSLKQQGITEVYIDITGYNDADELPKAADRKAKTAAFTTALRDEVRTLHAQGIQTHALAGGTMWGNADYWYIPQKIQQYVHDYNASVTADERLAGIQFDIEFYSDPNFSDDKTSATTDYLTLTQKLIDQHATLFAAGASPVALGFTTAPSLDGSNPAIPAATIPGVPTGPVVTALLYQLRNTPHAYLALMAYRNHTDGPDGTIAKSQATLQAAKAAGSVSVIIGEETNKVTPAKLTFYGRTKNDVKQSTLNIWQALGTNPAFGGFGIHDFKGFFQLSDG